MVSAMFCKILFCTVHVLLYTFNHKSWHSLISGWVMSDNPVHSLVRPLMSNTFTLCKTPLDLLRKQPLLLTYLKWFLGVFNRLLYEFVGDLPRRVFVEDWVHKGNLGCTASGFSFSWTILEAGKCWRWNSIILGRKHYSISICSESRFFIFHFSRTVNLDISLTKS